MLNNIYIAIIPNRSSSSSRGIGSSHSLKIIIAMHQVLT